MNSAPPFPLAAAYAIALLLLVASGAAWLSADYFAEMQSRHGSGRGILRLLYRMMSFGLEGDVRYWKLVNRITAVALLAMAFLCYIVLVPR